MTTGVCPQRSASYPGASPRVSRIRKPPSGGEGKISGLAAFQRLGDVQILHGHGALKGRNGHGTIRHRTGGNPGGGPPAAGGRRPLCRRPQHARPVPTPICCALPHAHRRDRVHGHVRRGRRARGGGGLHRGRRGPPTGSAGRGWKGPLRREGGRAGLSLPPSGPRPGTGPLCGRPRRPGDRRDRRSSQGRRRTDRDRFQPAARQRGYGPRRRARLPPIVGREPGQCRGRVPLGRRRCRRGGLRGGGAHRQAALSSFPGSTPSTWSPGGTLGHYDDKERRYVLHVDVQLSPPAQERAGRRHPQGAGAGRADHRRRRGRRLRHQGLAVRGAPADPVGGEKAGPPGQMVVRALRGPAGRRARPGQRERGRTGLRRRRQNSRPPGQDAGQCGGLRVVGAELPFGVRLHRPARRGLRHSGAPTCTSRRFRPTPRRRRPTAAPGAPKPTTSSSG